MSTEQRSPTTFIDKIVEWIELGGGIVPMFGAGISIASGIPAIVGTQEYLYDCVRRSVAYEAPAGTAYAALMAGRWNPHFDPWPEMEFGAAAVAAREHRKQEFEKAASRPKPTASLSEARGAVTDWRTALVFLSRLEPLMEKTGRGKKLLGAPKDWIIDGFVRHMVANKRPSLEHRMLAILSDLLRVRIGLTTNFDDLYEQAFRDARLALTTFDVHLHAGMPAGSVVHNAGPALVKVHGGRYGFRADYSLETPPTSDDRRTFTSYIAGMPIDSEEWENLHAEVDTDELAKKLRVFREDTAIPRSLLIAGVGANDPRILRLLQAAIRPLSRRAKMRERELPQLFWVAYTNEDVNNVLELKRNFPEVAERIVVTQERYFGLLLLELYQRLTSTLPSTAAEAPTMWRLGTPPLALEAKTETKGAAEGKGKQARQANKGVPAVEKDEDRVYELLFPEKPGTKPPQPVVVIEGRREGDDELSDDIHSVVAKVYDKALNNFKACVWVELDEVADADELFERILQGMGKRIGDDRQMLTRASDHAQVGENPIVEIGNKRNDRLEELRSMSGKEDATWCIFLHGADGIGTSLNFSVNTEIDRRSRWEMLKRDNEESNDEWSKLVELIRHLTSAGDGAGKNRIKVILTLDEPISRKAVVKALNKKSGTSVPHEVHRIEKTIKVQAIVEHGWKTADAAAPDATRLLEGFSIDFRRFVYMQTFWELPRYPSALLLWAARLDADLPRFSSGSLPSEDISKIWLSEGLKFAREMTRFGWCRFKSGGFVWMQNILKDHLRRALEENPAYLGEKPTDFVATIHQNIADWYWKLFVSSGNTSSLFESIKHRLRCAAASIEARGRAGAAEEHPAKRHISSIFETAMSLRLARGALLSRGYTPGVCKRLDMIETALKRWKAELNEKKHPSKNVQRLSAQEIASLNTGIDDTIYEIHTSLSLLALEVADGRKIIFRRLMTEETKEEMNQDRKDRLIRSPAVDHLAMKHPKEMEALALRMEDVRNDIAMLQFAAAEKTLLACHRDLGKLVAATLKWRLPALTLNTMSEEALRGARRQGADVGARLLDTPEVLRMVVKLYHLAMQMELAQVEAWHVCVDYVAASESGARDGSGTHTHKQLNQLVWKYHFVSQMTRFMRVDQGEFVAQEQFGLKHLYATVLSISGEHTEANQRFNEAHALAAFIGGGGRTQMEMDGETGVLKAEAVLRSIYQTDGSFHRRFGLLGKWWCARGEGKVEFLKLPLSTNELTRVLARLWDADAVLESVREKSLGLRKDGRWTLRYFYARLRAEAFRCVALSGTDQHARLLESRGDGLPSSILQMASLLAKAARVVRTDVFLFSRCCQQAHMAREALKRWHCDAELDPARPMPAHLRARLERELGELERMLCESGNVLAGIIGGLEKSGTSKRRKNRHAMPDDYIATYAGFTIAELRKLCAG